MRYLFALTVLTVGIIAGARTAHATARVVDGSNKTIYFSTAGKKLSPLEANRLGENNEPVLACKLQDYECNERTGKCALKNAK